MCCTSDPWAHSGNCQFQRIVDQPRPLLELSCQEWSHQECAKKRSFPGLKESVCTRMWGWWVANIWGFS